jgi:EAL domain-containing protein (putative c-di-GMP-specific phosphodiesterase class I)
MSVNLSPLQVRDRGHMELFGKAIGASGVPPARVKVEITESVFVDLTAEIVDSLEALRKVGVQLVLDDFGTGYSSLNHLQALPFDGLKVDRAFVARALADVRSRNLVRSIASLAGGLSMHSVAEGVETEAQRDFLREAGYDYLQGFLFGRPQSHGDVEATLAAASLGKPRTTEM